MGKIRNLIQSLKNTKSIPRLFMSKILLHSRLGPLVGIKRDGYWLRLYPTTLSHSLFMGANTQYLEDERFIRSTVVPGALVVDIGANIGTFSLLCAHCAGQTGRVISVEPHPRIFRYLCGNISFNHRDKNIMAHNCAVGEAIGKLYLTDDLEDVTNHLRENAKGIPVPVTTLDALLEDISGEIDLLKIDVEGFERFVIRGGPKTLKRTRVLYIEVADAHYRQYGYLASDLFNDLRAAGFSLWFASSDGTERPASYPVQSDRTYENLIARRNESSHHA